MEPDEQADETLAYDRKLAAGNPVTAQRLATYEQIADQTGVSPHDQRQASSAGDTQYAKVLTIPVEFDPQAGDDFSGLWVPETQLGSRECVQLPRGTLRNGPLHNHIPNPADAAQTDNQTLWLPDFDQQYYEDLIYSKTGVTERARMDLTGGDGAPGIDISGYTLRKLYRQMSQGEYVIRGEATPWVQVDHSEAWYAAGRCYQVDGEWVPPVRQSNDGHPDNALGHDQFAIDALTELAVAQPDFAFEKYDREDQGDVDGDGNLFEPDGVIDHLALVHAGKDKSTGGGAQGTDAFWSFSGSIPGSVEIPGAGGMRVASYVVVPENLGVGLLAHEYGHDLGLPDMYDTSGAADPDLGYWDLMSVGSHPGLLYQTVPTHMGLWEKWVLGWAEPLEVATSDEARAVEIGQNTHQPAGTEDGVRVLLPPKAVTIAEPHSGRQMWWSSSDQTWADNSLTREVTVPAGDDMRFWMWNNYEIEAYWDFGFVELSTDGGASWSQPVVTAEDGTVVTTPDDPHGNLAFFGRDRGLTGTSGGWRHDFVDLTPYAGSEVLVRLSMATDAYTMERGWFADDFAVTADGVAVWSDDVESRSNGWTATVGSWYPGTPLGHGWTIDTGTSTKSHYYLAEWRNFRGFDAGLRYGYDNTYLTTEAWKVEHLKYNSRGMLVWYRDTTYGDLNHVVDTTLDLPSTGSKGGLLLVDSHFDPLRRSGEAAEMDPSTLDNLGARTQASNVAFGLHPTFRFHECIAGIAGQDFFSEYCNTFGRQPAVPTFTDDQTWYPGIEIRDPDQGTWDYRDIDASVVLPNGDNAPYTTRVVDPEGNLLPEWYGEDLGSGIVLGTGEPTSPLGVTLDLQSVGEHNRYATVWVDPAD